MFKCKDCPECGAGWLTDQSQCKSCGAMLVEVQTPPEHQGKDCIVVCPMSSDIVQDFAKTLAAEPNPCSHCDGSGWVLEGDLEDYDRVLCPICNGDGI